MNIHDLFRPLTSNEYFSTPTGNSLFREVAYERDPQESNTFTVSVRLIRPLDERVEIVAREGAVVAHRGKGFGASIEFEPLEVRAREILQFAIRYAQPA